MDGRETQVDTGHGTLPVVVVEGPRGAPAVVLAPGAGSHRNHPALVALRAAVASAGYTAVGFDFPYRAAGRRAPDRPPVLEAAWRAVLAWTASTLAPAWIAIGGRSMGGRIAAHVAAAGAHVRGLVFLAFPLHPAGRPGTTRAAPLARIAVPMLFLQGTRDALADATLLRDVLAPLRHATLHAIDGADHAFHVPRRSGRTDADVQAEIEHTVVAWLDGLRA